MNLKIFSISKKCSAALRFHSNILWKTFWWFNLIFWLQIWRVCPKGQEWLASFRILIFVFFGRFLLRRFRQNPLLSQTIKSKIYKNLNFKNWVKLKPWSCLITVWQTFDVIFLTQINRERLSYREVKTQLMKIGLSFYSSNLTIPKIKHS